MGGGLYLSTLLSLDIPSICKYLQTAMSGIYVKVMAAESAVRLFQSAPYQSGNKWNRKCATFANIVTENVFNRHLQNVEMHNYTTVRLFRSVTSTCDNLRMLHSLSPPQLFSSWFLWSLQIELSSCVCRQLLQSSQMPNSKSQSLAVSWWGESK